MKHAKTTTAKLFGASALAVLTTFFIGVTPASAHPFVTPNAIERNKSSELAFSVYAEGESPMVAIEIEIPPSFTVSNVSPSTGWKSSQQNNTLKLSGTPIPLNNAAFFGITGTGSQLGELEFTTTTVAQDGKRVDWNDEGVRPSPNVMVVKKLKSDRPLPTWVFFSPAILLVVGGAVFFGIRSWRT